MSNIRSDARNDCHHALADAASDKAKWELTELDSQLMWVWTRRELSLVVSSVKLEGILRRRMEECIAKVTKERESGRLNERMRSIYNVSEERENQRLKEWMNSEFVVERRKRLGKEWRQTRERMEKEMKGASERAEREGRLWRDQGPFDPQD
jgi:hypothetical protein